MWVLARLFFALGLHPGKGMKVLPKLWGIFCERPTRQSFVARSRGISGESLTLFSGSTEG